MHFPKCCEMQKERSFIGTYYSRKGYQGEAEGRGGGKTAAMSQRLGAQAIGGQTSSEAGANTGTTSASHSNLSSITCYCSILDTFAFGA